jgi:hypothetical protein
VSWANLSDVEKRGPDWSYRRNMIDATVNRILDIEESGSSGPVAEHEHEPAPEVIDEISRQIEAGLAEIERVETERMWGAWPDLPPADLDGDITIWPPDRRRAAPA